MEGLYFSGWVHGFVLFCDVATELKTGIGQTMDRNAFSWYSTATKVTCIK